MFPTQFRLGLDPHTSWLRFRRPMYSGSISSQITIWGQDPSVPPTGWRIIIPSRSNWVVPSPEPIGIENNAKHMLLGAPRHLWSNQDLCGAKGSSEKHGHLNSKHDEKDRIDEKKHLLGILRDGDWKCCESRLGSTVSGLNATSLILQLPRHLCLPQLHRVSGLVFDTSGCVEAYRRLSLTFPVREPCNSTSLYPASP